MSQQGVKRIERKPIVKKAPIQIKNFDDMDANYEETKNTDSFPPTFIEKKEIENKDVDETPVHELKSPQKVV